MRRAGVIACQWGEGSVSGGASGGGGGVGGGKKG